MKKKILKGWLLVILLLQIVEIFLFFMEEYFYGLILSVFSTIFIFDKVVLSYRSIKKVKLQGAKLDFNLENNEKTKKDIVSIIEIIGRYIKNDDFKSLKEFYLKIQCGNPNIEKLKFSNEKLISESAIYNILMNKYYWAKKEQIEFTLEIEADLKKMNIKPYELAKILGILLDNAIEASRECEEKYIFLSFVSEEKKDVIKIYNTYDNTKKIDINKLFIKGYSTKSKNTGLGLWEIKKILRRHSNLDLYTNKRNNIFLQEFSIYY